MTTIATDGKSMAADCQVTASSERVGRMTKIFKTSDGCIFGGSGPAVDCEKFRRWMIDGGEPPELSEEFCGIILRRDGSVRYISKDFVEIEYIAPQAIGSGAEYAIGAMLAGSTPERAVEIACERDVYSGGPTTVITL